MQSPVNINAAAPRPKRSLLRRYAPALGMVGGALLGGYAANRGWLGQTAQKFTRSILNPAPSVNDTAHAYNYAGSSMNRTGALRSEMKDLNLEADAVKAQNPYLNQIRDRFQFPGTSIANDIKETVTGDGSPVHPYVGLASELGFGAAVPAIGSGIDFLAKARGQTSPGASKFLGRAFAGLGVAGDLMDMHNPNRSTGMANLLREVDQGDTNSLRLHQSAPLLASDAVALMSANPIAAVAANVGTSAVDAKAALMAEELRGLETSVDRKHRLMEHMLQLYRASKSPNPDVANRAAQHLAGLKRSTLGNEVLSSGSTETPNGLADRLYRWFSPVEAADADIDMPAARSLFAKMHR